MPVACGVGSPLDLRHDVSNVITGYRRRRLASFTDRTNLPTCAKSDGQIGRFVPDVPVGPWDSGILCVRRIEYCRSPIERTSEMNEVTRILNAIENGDKQAAARLLPLVYDELRKLAAAKLANEKPGLSEDGR